MGTGYNTDGEEVEIDDAYWEGCTRWREHEGAGDQKVEAPRAPHCVEAASDVKCACGVVICQRCKEASRNTDGDVWQSCANENCARTFACSKCINSLHYNDGVLRGCAGCGDMLCDECRTTCDGCDKTLCRGDCSMYNGHCESCYQDGRGRSRSRSRSGSYERQMEFEMRSYGRY